MASKRTAMIIASVSVVSLGALAGAFGLTQIATATSTHPQENTSEQQTETELLLESDGDLGVNRHQPGGEGTTGFYSPGDTRTLWTEYISTITAPLPDGIVFPKTLKQFEDTPGETHWLEDKAVAVLAGGYWECAWKEAAVAALRAGDHVGYLHASRTSSAWYDLLPGLEDEKEGWLVIETQAQEAAAARGITPDELMLELACGMYFEEKSTR